MGGMKVDMGASWIHGIGPGCGEDPEWDNKENPIYTIAKINAIQTVATWEDEESAVSSYYWAKTKEGEPLDEDRVDKMLEKAEEFISAK